MTTNDTGQTRTHEGEHRWKRWSQLPDSCVDCDVDYYFWSQTEIERLTSAYIDLKARFDLIYDDDNKQSIEIKRLQTEQTQYPFSVAVSARADKLKPLNMHGRAETSDEVIVLVSRERDEAQRYVIALQHAVYEALSRLASYGAPFEDLSALLAASYSRPLDVEALLLTDPVYKAKVDTWLHERMR